MIRFLFALSLCLVSIGHSQGHKIYLNGLSYHFTNDDPDLNETNTGLGYAYLLSTKDNKVEIWAEIDAYDDSFSEFGYAFGLAAIKPIGENLSIGLKAGLIHEENLVDKSGLYLFPYLLPFVETRFDIPVNFRVTFIPPVKNDGIITLQGIVRF